MQKSPSTPEKMQVMQWQDNIDDHENENDDGDVEGDDGDDDDG